MSSSVFMSRQIQSESIMQCNAMQHNTSYIIRCAPLFAWLSSYSAGAMHLIVCVANERCFSKTTALRVAAEGHRLNNSFLNLTQATMLREMGCHLIWNLWIKVTDSSVTSSTAFGSKELNTTTDLSG